KAAPVRGDNQVVSVNREVAHRAWRQVELQRLPMISIIKRDENSQFSARKEQPAPQRVFLHGLHINARWQAAGDLLPRLAAIARAIDVRVVVGQAMPIYRSIGFVQI